VRQGGREPPVDREALRRNDAWRTPEMQAQLRCNQCQRLAQNRVAMQENPVSSAYCPLHDWSYNARVLKAGAEFRKAQETF